MLLHTCRIKWRQDEAGGDFSKKESKDVKTLNQLFFNNTKKNLSLYKFILKVLILRLGNEKYPQARDGSRNIPQGKGRAA